MACGGSSSSEQTTATGKNFQEQCDRTISQCNKLNKAVDNLSGSGSVEQILEVQRLSDELSFDYDAASLDSAQLAQAEEVDALIAELKQTISQQTNQMVAQGYWYLVNKPEELLTETTEYPIYLERGEMLFLDITTEKPADIRIYNVNSHQLQRSYIGKSRVKDSLAISFSSVYVVEINPRIRQYASVELTYHPNSIDRLTNPKQVTSQQVEGQKGDFRVRTVKGIQMKNLFEEPRKFTLRGQLKAAFSGSYRMGTQSCNGRIPAKGYRTIYLGFLNERMRYNNYVWLEAVSAVPNTEYFKTEYTVK